MTAVPKCPQYAGVSGHWPNHPAQPSLPSRPGEFHPEPLTEPDMTLSRHPARATARRLPHTRTLEMVDFEARLRRLEGTNELRY